MKKYLTLVLMSAAVATAALAYANKQPALAATDSACCESKACCETSCCDKK